MNDDDTLNRLIAQWNRAAIEPGHWAEAVSSVARTLDATSGLLFNPEGDASGRLLTTWHGGIETAVAEYAAHWRTEDPWFVRMDELRVRHAAGEASVGRRYVNPGKLRHTGFYQDFSKQYGIHDTLSLLVCDERDPSAPVTRLTFHRPIEMPEFSTADCRMLEACWPHFQRAIQSYWLLRKAREFDRIAEGALDAVPHPCWVVREDGLIDYANSAAVTLATNHSPWLAIENSRIRQVGRFDFAALRSACLAPLAGPPLAATCVSSDRLQFAALHVIPIRERPSYATVWPRASALVMLDLTRTEQSERLRAFAYYHGLTPTETRVLGLLLGGNDVPTIAGSLQVAYSTARTHVSRLLDKTRCSRQTELISRLSEP